MNIGARFSSVMSHVFKNYHLYIYYVTFVYNLSTLQKLISIFLINYILLFYLHFQITGNLLYINKLDIDRDTCEAVLRWSYPTVDSHLVTNYTVWRYSFHNNNWLLDETVSVGIVTQYNTKCTLQPGCLYNFNVYQYVSLTDPDESILSIIGRTIVTGTCMFLVLFFVFVVNYMYNPKFNFLKLKI